MRTGGANEAPFHPASRYPYVHGSSGCTNATAQGTRDTPGHIAQMMRQACPNVNSATAVEVRDKLGTCMLRCASQPMPEVALVEEART